MTCLAFPNDPEIDLFPGLVHRAAAQMERHQAVSRRLTSCVATLQLISKKGAALLRFLLAKVATAAAAHVQEPISNIKRARSTSTPFNLHRTNQYSSPFHPVQSYSTSSSELAPSEAPSTQASASSRRSAEKSTQAALDVDLSSFLGSDIFEFGSSTGEAQGVDFSFRCS
ncbi:BQ5605_C015g07799 [Microbotryum silenes-dioicae]|uniref:BQ5605_C015g07799 protein n=1 Tax=Microbotryum silenes-dioicae TaxID=796604 RepID=A0A2X0LX22_9BASI|nr:BQ5605_C015g07799 [Microbotryum silenes-dioicae]